MAKMRMLLLPFAFILLPLMAQAAPFPERDPAPLSQYGVIQNVQNYSSNPFWNNDGSYRMRVPVPVYVNGPDLNTADCVGIARATVALVCSAQDNCFNKRLADVRPAIMVQMSEYGGYNYVGACNGFIDSAFAEYTAGTRNRVTPSAFPMGGAPVAPTQTIQIQNPYEIKTMQFNGDEWEQKAIDRENELRNLQAQNGAGNEKLARANFPGTVADLSFEERNDLRRTGYEPYANASPYEVLKLETWEEQRSREQITAQYQRDTYCAQNPNAPECVKKNETDETSNGRREDGRNPGASSAYANLTAAQAYAIDIAWNSCVEKLAADTTVSGTLGRIIATDPANADMALAAAEGEVLKILQQRMFSDETALCKNDILKIAQQPNLEFAFNYNGAPHKFNIDIKRLFDLYTTHTYIFVYNSSEKRAGDIVAFSDFSEKYYWPRECSAINPMVNVPNKSTINLAGQSVLGNQSGQEYFLDRGANTSLFTPIYMFPGLLFQDKKTFGGGTGGDIPFEFTHLPTAIEQVKKFADAVNNTPSGGCNGLAVYLAAFSADMQTALKSDTKTDKIYILSDAYPIR